jgi:hypothetical protein
MRKLGLIVLGVLCAALTQAAAVSAGGPSPGVTQGGGGLERGDIRYVALPSGGGTALAAVRRHGGRVVRFVALPGSWGIPTVAFDGTTDGLSRDGRALVLAQASPGSPLRTRSSFLVLDAQRFKIRDTIRLKGDFNFDALAPDMHYLYLVEHISAEDVTRYRVRAYDLRAKRLLPKIISDKTSWETDMQGMPVSRVTSRDRGWAYTLYGGAGPRPFIHALDARRAAAVCIDMPWKYQPENVFQYRLRSDGDGHLLVRGPRGRTLAVVDTRGKRVLSFVRNP